MMFLWLPFLFLIPLAMMWMMRSGTGMGGCGMSHAGHAQTPVAGGPDPVDRSPTLGTRRDHHVSVRGDPPRHRLRTRVPGRRSGQPGHFSQQHARTRDGGLSPALRRRYRLITRRYLEKVSTTSMGAVCTNRCHAPTPSRSHAGGWHVARSVPPRVRGDPSRLGLTDGLTARWMWDIYRSVAQMRSDG